MLQKEPGRHQDLLRGRAVAMEVGRGMRPLASGLRGSEESSPLALEQCSSLLCTHLADKKTEAPWDRGPGLCFLGFCSLVNGKENELPLVLRPV